MVVKIDTSNEVFQSTIENNKEMSKAEYLFLALKLKQNYLQYTLGRVMKFIFYIQGMAGNFFGVFWYVYIGEKIKKLICYMYPTFFGLFLKSHALFQVQK